MAPGFSGMMVSVSRMARMRSTPTAACAIALVVVAMSFTGLKNLFRYDRYTVNAPTVMAPARIRYAPRHRTTAVQTATVTVTTGDRIALMLRAFSAAFTVA